MMRGCSGEPLCAAVQEPRRATRTPASVRAHLFVPVDRRTTGLQNQPIEVEL
jgi:hypothetical protein